jgi:hypothetical protein
MQIICKETKPISGSTLLQFDKEKNIVKRKENYLDTVYIDTTPQGHQNRYRRSAVKNSRTAAAGNRRK